MTDEETHTFDLRTTGSFSFASTARFLEGFTPAAMTSGADAPLRYAFPVDGSWLPGGATLLPLDDGTAVRMRTFGEASPAVVRDQVRRALSLDIDGTGYDEVIERDPALAAIATRMPGLRPVLFFSPYEAAAWAIIATRVRMTQAAAIRTRMTRELGSAIDIDGEAVFGFPAPHVLRELEGFPGLFGRKAEYLRELGQSAEEGMLDVDYLRAQPFDEARRHLLTLPGIGPFGADLILIRGVGLVDRAPTADRRLATAVRLAYGLASDPNPEQLAEIAEGWAPFRTWVSVLLRSNLDAIG